MTTQTQFFTFNFESKSIRALAINDAPWFVAVDVCNALNIANSRDALLKLDDDEKTTVGLTDSQAGNGAQSLSLVSESGMYTLILRCRDAVKKGSVPHRFRKWVTAEVLPAIRKTGKYEKPKQLELPDEQLPISLRQKKHAKELTECQWLRLASLWVSLYYTLELLEKIHKPLSGLGSSYASTAYTYAREYETTLGTTKRLLEPLLAEFQPDPMYDAHYYHALKVLQEYKPQGLGKLAVI